MVGQSSALPKGHRSAVVLCCDDGYLPYASFVAFQAAVLHPDRGFDILICSDQALSLPRALIDQGVTFRQLKPEDAFQVLKIRHLPRSAYLRLWLPQALGDDYDRLLYLDCDVFLEAGGLDVLLGIDLGPHPVGAVRDIQQWLRPHKHVREFRIIGAEPAPYFNSGVLLIDTGRFEAESIRIDCIEVAAQFGRKFPFHDQSLLNAVLRNRWTELSPMWNWQWAGKRPLWGQMIAPRISHFAGHAKPWNDPDGLCPPRYMAAIANFVSRTFPDRELKLKVGSTVLRGTSGFSLAVVEHLFIRRRIERYIARFADDMDVKH